MEAVCSLGGLINPSFIKSLGLLLVPLNTCIKYYIHGVIKSNSLHYNLVLVSTTSHSQLLFPYSVTFDSQMVEYQPYHELNLHLCFLLIMT